MTKRIILNDIFSSVESVSFKTLLRNRNIKYETVAVKKNNRLYEVSDVGIDEILKLKKYVQENQIICKKGFEKEILRRSVLKRIDWCLYCLENERYVSFEDYQIKDLNIKKG